MRVVQVTPRYHPIVGGVETKVKEISERLAEKGFEIDVLTTDPLGELPREEIINGVRVVRFKTWTLNEAYYLPHPSMLSYLSTEQLDIIHAHNIHTLPTLIAYISHDLHTKSRFVVSPFYHGRGHTKLAQMLWIFYRPLAKKILKNADGILVNSKAQRTLIKRAFGPSSKIFMVHDGLDLDGIKNTESFTFDDDQKKMLYIGRLEKYKNVHIAIESMQYLNENYHFYVIGFGPFRPVLEKLVRSLGLQSRVHFLGFQPNDVVHRWLKTCDVFVHLSAVESFGMTCIESLAAGTPVIANDDAFGLSETSALYPEHIRVYRTNTEPISRLAELVIEVAELKPIIADVSEFSWHLIAERVGSIYKELLS